MPSIPLRAQVRPYGFAPVTGWDDEQRAKYPIGAVVYLSIRKGRSPKMQRFYWAIVDHVASAIGYDKEELSDELLTRTKRIDSHEFINGTISIRPKRISKMGHVEFKDYVDAAIELICAEYLSEMTAGELLREIERMLNITYMEAFALPNKKEEDDGVQ